MIDSMPRSMSSVAHLLLPVDYQIPLKTKVSIIMDQRLHSYWLRYMLCERLNDVVPNSTFSSASQDKDDVTRIVQALFDRYYARLEGTRLAGPSTQPTLVCYLFET
jgi:hypothetical protein